VEGERSVLAKIAEALQEHKYKAEVDEKK